jgi:hypothetical protein
VVIGAILADSDPATAEQNEDCFVASLPCANASRFVAGTDEKSSKHQA